MTLLLAGLDEIFPRFEASWAVGTHWVGSFPSCIPCRNSQRAVPCLPCSTQGRAGLAHSAGGERILQSTKCAIIYIYVCVYVDKTRQAAMVRSGAALRMLPLSGKCLGSTSLDLEEFIWDFRRGHWGKVTDSGLLVLCVQRSRGWLCWTLHHLNIPRLQCLGRSRCRSGPGPAER